MPERRRIVRFEIVFSYIPFLLCLSQITEPEPEPHPHPPRKALEMVSGFLNSPDQQFPEENSGFSK